MDLDYLISNVENALSFSGECGDYQGRTQPA